MKQKQTDKRIERRIVSWREEVRRWAERGGGVDDWMATEHPSYTSGELRRAIARFQPMVDRIRVGQQAKRKRDNARAYRKQVKAPIPSATSILSSGHSIDHTTGEILNEVQQQIAAACDGLKKLLLEKNTNYGNSALEPKRRFSQASPIEQILVRMDDKWNRIERTGWSSPDEDTLQDFIGYAILLKVAIARGSK